MYLILSGIIAGVIGTFSMDLFNHLLSRIGAVNKIDFSMIGRMSAGWMRMRFMYVHPNEIEHVAKERIIGYAAHYCIGIGFALIFIFGWDLLIGGPVSPVWTMVYGIVTVAGSWFLIYPSMGLGIMGMKSDEGNKNAITSIVNHTFFGIGMALAVSLI